VTSDREWLPLILVVEGVEETRDGIQRLLVTSGYQVGAARNEEEAIRVAGFRPPDLILISPGLDALQILSTAMRIRERAGLNEEIPVVVFCITSLDEGAEVAAGHNVYLTRPDNFDQLRALLGRLLRKLPQPG
jgi:CheY-like chemotaxis protein